MEKTTYKGIELEVNLSDSSWTYDGGVASEKVKKMNPELYDKVDAFAKDYVKNFEAIKEKEREEKKAANIAERIIKIAEFKKSFITEYGDKFKGIELTFSDPENSYTDANRVVFGSTGFSVEYSPNVSGYYYGSSKTASPWSVQDNHYKNRRYAKLETAVNKIVERIAEDEEDRKQKIVASNETERKENLMKEFADERGLVYKKEEIYHRSRYNGQGYNTTHYFMVKGNVQVVLEWDYSNARVITGTCTLTKSKMSDVEIAEMVQLDKKFN